MLKKIVLVFCATAASVLFSGTSYTWQGGGSGDWNQPSNWSPQGTPGGDDVAVFSANANLTGDVVIGSAKLTVQVATDKTVVLSGAFSGAGGFVSSGSGTLVLSGNNSFAGNCEVKTGTLLLQSDTAAGAAAVSLSSNGKLIVDTDVTISNNIEIAYAGTPFTLRDGSAVGSVNVGYNYYCTLQVADGGTAHIRAIGGGTQSALSFRSAARYVIDQTFTSSGNLNIDKHTSPVIELAAGGSKFKSWANFVSGRIVFDTVNGFQPSFGWHFSGANATSFFDMNGNSQTISSLGFGADLTGHGYGVTSAAPAMATWNLAKDIVFRGQFTGAAGLDWAPTDGNTLTISGVGWPTRGTLKVSSGTVAVESGVTATNLAEIIVTSGAELTVDALGADIAANALSIAEGALLTLGNGVMLKVSEGQIGSVELEEGRTYSNTDFPGIIMGGGFVYCRSADDPGPTSGSAVWTGEALSGDAAREADNWKNASLPNFTSGGWSLQFAESGTSATFPSGESSFNAISLDAPGDFRIASASPYARLVAQGLTLADNLSEPPDPPAMKTYALDMPMTLITPLSLVASSQESAGDVTLTAAGGLDVRGAVATYQTSLYVEGPYVLNLRGTNRFEKGMYVRRGVVHAYNGDALGKEGVTIWRRSPYNPALHLHGGVYSNPLYFQADSISLFADEGVNTISNEVSGVTTPFRCRAESGAELRFCDHLYGGHGFYPESASDGWIVLAGTRPYRFTTLSIAQYCNLRISVPNNTNTANVVTFRAGSKIFLDVPHAFANKPGLTLKEGAVLDLQGNPQEVGTLAGDEGLDTKLTSATSATFDFMQSTAATNGILIEGGVSLVKRGPETASFSAQSSTTGTLSIVEGRFEILPDGGFTNATQVAVAGTGVLAAADNTEGECVFGKDTRLSLDAEGGSIEIPADRRLRVAELYLGETKMPNGTYGRLTGPEAIRTRLVGDGVLYVAGKGFCMLIR